MMPDRIRAFVALRLSDEVERTVAGLVDSLRSLDHRRGIRWVLRNKLHLTLRFLGDRVEAATLERIDGELVRIAAAIAPFAIGVRGIGAFPDLARPRAIWVGLESAEAVALADAIEHAAVAAGLEPEHRVYSPHLTIGRLRDGGGWKAIRPAIEAAAERDFGNSPARWMVLYRSILGESASYEELARYTFRGRS
jgi:RNA 2',3'-cyclic 3'-phosphodiesterase